MSPASFRKSSRAATLLPKATSVCLQTPPWCQRCSHPRWKGSPTYVLCEAWSWELNVRTVLSPLWLFPVIYKLHWWLRFTCSLKLTFFQYILLLVIYFSLRLNWVWTSSTCYKKTNLYSVGFVSFLMINSRLLILLNWCTLWMLKTSCYFPKAASHFPLNMHTHRAHFSWSSFSFQLIN